jgi:hypothetical protein
MKLSIILGIIYLFISCKNENQKSEKFIGKWNDTEYIIPSKSFIEIKPNHTFYYRSYGCEWRSISKGSWKFYNDTIELTSGKIDTCYNSLPFMMCLKFGYNVKMTKTISNCNPKSDTDFSLFQKECFYLKNDTLIYINNKKLSCLDSVKIAYAKTLKVK